MSCADIAGWYLRQRLPVIDLRSAAWQAAKAELLPSGYAPSVCLRRLEGGGKVRRISKGLYLVVDPVREPPLTAVASALFQGTDHYVTTDAALAMHGLLDQPLVMITVVLAAVRRRPVNLKSARVRPVWLGREAFSRSDRYETTQEGFTVWIAGREQSVVDALAEPKWMVHATLLPEVLVQLREDEVADVARRAIERSTAAAQRLGYLLEGSGLPIPESLSALRPKSAVELSPGRRAGAFSSRWRTYG